MGIFDSIFGGGKKSSGSTNESKISWNILTTLEQLDEIEVQSKGTPVLIFKHSTTCGISRMVIKQFEAEYDLEPSQMIPYYLDLKAYRNISNEIAARFKVMHQSPQVILIKNGAAVYDESHGSINVDRLIDKL